MTRTRTNLLSALGALAMAVALAGCGAGDKIPPGGLGITTKPTSSAPVSKGQQTGPCQQQVVASLCETFSITGDKSVSGTAVASISSNDANITCAKWVGEQPSDSDFPRIGAPREGKLGEHRVEMYWKYPFGPGSTSIDKYAGVNYLTLDGDGYMVVAQGLNEPEASTGTIEVKPDGSGKLTFAKLSNGKGGQIAGSITWTCIDSK